MPKIRQAIQKTEQAREPERALRAAELHHFPDVPLRSEQSFTALAVDPGEEHVGLAVGVMDAAAPRGWRVLDVAELNPWEFVQFFRDTLDRYDLVTCEKFTLYPHLAKEQIGSEMPTSKLIGWIEFTLRIWNESFTKDHHKPAYGMPEIQYTSYPANIHKGTEAVMRNKDIPFVSPKTPDHARSAELHFWHTLIRAGLVEGVTLA